MADADFWRDRWVETAKATHRQQLAEAETRREQAIAYAEAVYEREVQEATGVHNLRLQDAQAMYQSVLDETQRVYEDKRLDILNAVKTVDQAVAGVNQPWDHAYWRSWQPDSEASPPPVIRIGQLLEQGPWGNVTLPALLPLINGRNVLWKTTGQSKLEATQAIQSLLLRLLAAIPPGKLRFTFIDPVGLGQNVAAFMHLADYDEALIGGKAWTEPQHIEQRLADLTEHMEKVIQKYLRNQYATIEDYNEQAGEVAEPYRLLVVMDFPANFSEQAARRLVSIGQNGPRCGVYTVVLADTQKKLPHGFSLADLERHATVIRWEGERFVWEDADFRDCRLELDMPPDAELFNRIVNAVGAAAQAASKVEVPFERIAPAANTWQQGDSAEGLRAPLGPAGARTLQYLDLGSGTAQHVLVAGKTGSGKSTLLHVLITNLALPYSPDEVELYLIDFKKGVEFKTYAVHHLPHARVIAIESEREFGLSVLQGLDAELKRRGDLFRGAGVDGLADYRASSPLRAGEGLGEGAFPASCCWSTNSRNSSPKTTPSRPRPARFWIGWCARAGPLASTSCSAPRPWPAPTPWPAAPSTRWPCASPCNAARPIPA